MSDNKAVCVYCERGSEVVPLMDFSYKGKDYAICPEHLPVIIHKPEQLEGKLPEAGAWKTVDIDPVH